MSQPAPVHPYTIVPPTAGLVRCGRPFDAPAWFERRREARIGHQRGQVRLPRRAPPARSDWRPARPAPAAGRRALRTPWGWPCIAEKACGLASTACDAAALSRPDARRRGEPANGRRAPAAPATRRSSCAALAGQVGRRPRHCCRSRAISCGLNSTRVAGERGEGQRMVADRREHLRIAPTAPPSPRVVGEPLEGRGIAGDSARRPRHWPRPCGTRWHRWRSC